MLFFGRAPLRRAQNCFSLRSMAHRWARWISLRWAWPLAGAAAMACGSDLTEGLVADSPAGDASSPSTNDATVRDPSPTSDAAATPFDGSPEGATAEGGDGSLGSGDSALHDGALPQDGALEAPSDSAAADTGPTPFCVGKTDGTACNDAGTSVCCSGVCMGLSSTTNCGGCGVTCKGSANCTLVGIAPKRGYVCTCSGIACPTGQICFATAGTDTCNCTGDGVDGGCGSGQVCDQSGGIPARQYCHY